MSGKMTEAVTNISENVKSVHPETNTKKTKLNAQVLLHGACVKIYYFSVSKCIQRYACHL